MDVEPDMTRAMKTFRRVPKYGHAVGRIMVRESALLNWQRFERLIESDYEECLGILQETDYGPFLEEATVSEEVESGLQRFLEEQYLFIDDICGGTPIADFLHVKYDFHNLKVIFKEKYFGNSAEGMISGLGGQDVERLRGSVEASRSGNLAEYWELLIDRMRGEMEKDGAEPSTVDVLAERSYLERRLELAGQTKSRLMVNFARACVDVANLRIILRGRELEKGREYYELAMAEGGRLKKRDLLDISGETFDRLTAQLMSSKYGRMLDEVLGTEDRKARLTSLDRASDEYLLEKLGSLTRISVGPERIVKYMITREDEVVLLRVILMGKLHRLTAAAIEKRLSQAYMRQG